MELNEQESVAAIFTDAGWQPSTKDGWKGSFTWSDGVVVGGIDPWGTMRATSNAAFGMTREEAAAWLVEHARERAPVVLTTDATLAPPPEPEHDSAHEGDGETGEEADGAVQVLDADSVSEDGAGDNPLGEWFDYETTGDAGGGGGDVPLDADFADFADLPELGQEILDEHPEEHASGPIVYAASDLDALVREKLGRLGQIARAMKAELQQGWTLDEFRELQGRVVRMERGEAPNDAAARERYFWISSRSNAMSRVDEHRTIREGTLDELGQVRDYAGVVAFDPEVDWP